MPSVVPKFVPLRPKWNGLNVVIITGCLVSGPFLRKRTQNGTIFLRNIFGTIVNLDNAYTYAPCMYRKAVVFGIPSSWATLAVLLPSAARRLAFSMTLFVLASLASWRVASLWRSDLVWNTNFDLRLVLHTKTHWSKTKQNTDVFTKTDPMPKHIQQLASNLYNRLQISIYTSFPVELTHFGFYFVPSKCDSSRWNLQSRGRMTSLAVLSASKYNCKEPSAPSF